MGQNAGIMLRPPQSHKPNITRKHFGLPFPQPPGYVAPRGVTMYGDRKPFRRAIAASVGLHALLAVVVGLILRSQANRPEPAPPGIDTHVDVKLNFSVDDAAAPIVTPPSESPTTPIPPDPPPAPAPSPEQTEPARPPLAATSPPPRTLPPEMLALLRKPMPAPDVVEVPITPAPRHPSPAVQTASGAETQRPTKADSRPSADAKWAGGSPLHGSLAVGQSIVYVLDASGSMGEWGKFDAARRDLIATLKRQPETVRFQVVVYSGSASLPLSGARSGCIASTADNVAGMADALTRLERPTGRSNHLEGFQTALSLRPDFVLILTDANDLPSSSFRRALPQVGKPVVVCVAKVGAQKVEKPVELK